MPSVWELITQASSLDVGPDASLWDHLNNLEGNGAGNGSILNISGTLLVMAGEENKLFLTETNQLKLWVSKEPKVKL
jgi:hypothetical protein